MHFRHVFRKKKRTQPNKAEPDQINRSEDDEPIQWSDMQSDSLILVMGVTGAGKSYFINQLKPNSVTEGHGLGSQTKTCKLVQPQIGASTVAAVDTPGFDDDDDSDAAVLAKISRFLITQHLLDIPLKGIIFLHSITTIRFSGSHKRYLDTFRQICGDEALKNVALVTTMWSSEKQDVGLRRDAELQTGPWADLKAKGADVFQYNGSSAMAQTIVGQMMTKDDVVLRIQQELYKERGELDCTTAGAGLASQLEKKLKLSHKQIQNLNIQIKEAEACQDADGVQQLQEQLDEEKEKQLKQMESREALRPKIYQETEKRIEEVDRDKKTKGQKKSKLQIFIAVLGPIIAITTSLILPLAGVSLGA